MNSSVAYLIAWSVVCEPAKNDVEQHFLIGCIEQACRILSGEQSQQ